MNIFDLPFLSFLKRKKNTEYFLSLVLRDEKASAVVFEEKEGKVNVVGEHVEPFKTSIEDATDEELLEIIDRVVSTAEKNLPEGVESKKTIFGVKQSWIEKDTSEASPSGDGGQEKIKKEYLTKLKKVSDELGFSPMGFLVIPEAIAHLLQKEEGAPISAVLTEIERDKLTLYLIKGGKLLESKSGPIEEGIVPTFEKLLKHFTTPEVFPSKIILFDGGKEELQQDFIGHKWPKDTFLHIPQISSLPANFDARSVLNGAAKQMGFEVLEDSLNKAVKEDKGEVAPIDEGVGETETEDKTLEEAVSEFGFSGADVKEKNKPKTAVSDNFEEKDGDLAKQFREAPEEPKVKTADKRPLPINTAAIGAGILGFAKNLKLGGLIKTAASTPRRILLLGIPAALLTLYILIYIFARSATVTVFVDAKKSQQSENVTFSKDSDTNAGKNIIKAQFLTVSEDGKISTGATGKKETGEKAKGTVTVFNNSDSGITLPAGTTINSSNDLNFTTDKAVTVASASGDIFSGTDPGKATVSVTAEKFGTNYNLPSNTKFTIPGKSDMAAKNDNAFSGGTKKDIKVVAQADLDKLEKDIKKQLETGAKADITKKATGNSIVLPNFISETFDDKSFSKKVDDEATEVSITATVVYEGVSYQRPEIIAYAKEKLKEDISEELTIDEGSLDIEASGLKKKDGDASAKVTIKADLIPKIDQKETAKEIAGKSIEDAKSRLRDISQVNDVTVNIFLNLPPQRLPFSSGKIKIVLEKNG